MTYEVYQKDICRAKKKSYYKQDAIEIGNIHDANKKKKRKE